MPNAKMNSDLDLYTIYRPNVWKLCGDDKLKKLREPMRIPARKRQNGPTLDPEADPQGIIRVYPASLC